MMAEFSSQASWVSLNWRIVWWGQRDVRHQAYNVYQYQLRQLHLCRNEPPRGTDAAFLGLPGARRERACWPVSSRMQEGRVGATQRWRHFLRPV